MSEHCIFSSQTSNILSEHHVLTNAQPEHSEHRTFQTFLPGHSEHSSSEHIKNNEKVKSLHSTLTTLETLHYNLVKKNHEIDLNHSAKSFLSTLLLKNLSRCSAHKKS